MYEADEACLECSCIGEHENVKRIVCDISGIEPLVEDEETVTEEKECDAQKTEDVKYSWFEAPVHLHGFRDVLVTGNSSTNQYA